MPRTWILTGSPESYAATEAHDFDVIDESVLMERLYAAAAAPAGR